MTVHESASQRRVTSPTRGYRADEAWLRRVGVLGVILPVVFLAALETVRHVVLQRRWPHQSHLIAGTLAVVAAALFGYLMFRIIRRGHRLVLARNRELAAVSQISEAAASGTDALSVTRAILESLCSTSGAVSAGFVPSERPDEAASGDVMGPLLVGDADAPGTRPCEVLLTAGSRPVGLVTLQVPRQLPPFSEATLHSIGLQVGSAVHRAQLITLLRREQREAHAVRDVLLRISAREPLPDVLATIAALARDLLAGDHAAACIDDRAAGFLDLREAAPACAAGRGQLCLAAATPGADDLPLAACPAGDHSHYAAFLAVPVHGEHGGRIWVGRRTGEEFTASDQRFLTTLADLMSLALHTARMEEHHRRGAVLTERDRIAREMHDSLAQVLGVAHLRLRALGGLDDRTRDDIWSVEITDLADLCEDAYRDVREAILGLRESSRPDRTLLESLDIYIDKFSRQSRIDTQLDHEGDLVLPPQCEVQVLRIIQEALTNVRKHSGARSAAVRVESRPSETRITVTDDGVGFDPARTGADGFGLHTMRERAESVNGRLAVESAPGGGTRVIVALPHRPTASPISRSASA